MANNMVKFQRGLQEVYDRTAHLDNVFYYTTDTKNLYLGKVKLSNQAEIDAALELIQANSDELEGLGNWAAEQFQVIFGNQDVDLSMKNVAKTFTDPIIEDMGDTDNLSTTNKTVVGAINEVLAAVGTGGTAAVVTMTEGTDANYAKVYTLRQGDTLIGNINIPKDMVVKTGAVEVNPEGQPEGTYIVLTLANATEDKIYVNVGTLVDIYKAKASAAQVQIAIDSETREISATIVAGSITATELAENAVTTAKIADGNVTKAKLAAGVQASLDKADTAMQQANLDTLQQTLEGKIATAKGEAIADAEGKIAIAKGEAATDATNKANKALDDAKAYTDQKAGEGLKVEEFTTGTTAGTIKVREAEVKVAGLGSAAYTDASAFDAEGSAATAEANAKAHANGLIAALDADKKSAEVAEGQGVQVQVVEVDGKITEVNLTGNYDNKYDAKGAAAQALADAKTYADGEIDTIEETIAGINDEIDAINGDLTNIDGILTNLAKADADNLADAKSYADTKKTEAISDAKAYTDTAIEAAALMWEDIFENLN